MPSQFPQDEAEMIYDEGLHDLVGYAAEVLDAPISLVTELGIDRQRFLAEVGTGLTGTSMEVSFCKHAIREEGIFEVVDAALDERFASNALVTGEPHVRFYAGVPLVGRDGVRNGAFCILDDRPRQLSAVQRRTLQLLAKQAQFQLDRAHLQADLIEANHRLEHQVNERTERLRQAVAEAEAFNYSISHDLRAPLRAIVATSNILVSDLSQSLSPEHVGLLNRQSVNANQLARLIDELLNLSRLSRVELKRERVDVSDMVRSIARDLAPSRAFKINSDISADADPVLLRALLQNLLENAHKFSPGGSEIEIGQSADTIWVRDYGIGFDEAYLKKIFLPFERLVSNDEFTGTGIGLAIVKRIVDRHEGSVWATSILGQGSTFYFTLQLDSQITDASSLIETS